MTSSAYADEANGEANSWRYSNGQPIAVETQNDSGGSGGALTAQSNSGYAGIDVSEFQKSIDWSAVKSSGVQFAMIRCGYGSNVRPAQDDDYWAANVSGCKANGIPYGVYLYSYATDTAMAQSEAAHTIALLQEQGIDSGSDMELPIYLDMEDTSTAGCSASTLAAIFSAYKTALNNAGYDRVGVYANCDWWQNHLYDINLDSAYIWVASWFNDNSTDHDPYQSFPSISSNGYGVWQYGTTTVSGISGDVDADYMPAWVFSRNVSRLSGANALDTMSEIVDTGFTSTGGTVVLTTGAGYWDALTASGIAGLSQAPVLLTSIDGVSLSSQTKAELKRLAPSKIIVCGGTAAVSEAVVSAARTAAGTTPTVVRCAGGDAVGTANDIYAQAASATGNSFDDTAFIATNDGYWDALAIAPYAYAKGHAIFLTNGSGSISAATLSAMKAGGIKNFYIVGGTDAVSDAVKAQLTSAGFTFKQRLAGDTAVETSSAIASFELSSGMTANKMAVATTSGYWDALTGAALCGKNASVLVLANDGNRSSISAIAASNKSSISTAYVFGGTAAVSTNTQIYLTNALQ